MKHSELKNIIKESITDYLSELNSVGEEGTPEETKKESLTSTPGRMFEDKVTKDKHVYLVKEAMNESTEKDLVEKKLLTDLIGEGMYEGAYLNEAAAMGAAKKALKAKEVLMKENVKKGHEKVSGLEGFGKKSIDNLKAAIEVSKAQPLYRFIYALGIRFVGETTAKTIASRINHLLDLTRITEDQLLEFEDIGIKVASSIVQFFHDPNQLKIIESLIQLGLNVEQTNQQPTDGTLTGLNFLFTGTLIQLKRSDAEAMVEAKGGHILSGVSSKLNYLIVGEDAGSKLEKAKKIASIKIITEAEFIDLVK